MSEFYTKPLGPEIEREGYARRLGSEAVSLWFRTEDSGGMLDMEITGDNTQVFLNRTASEMDAFSIRDPRDEQCWVRFRYEYEDEAFINLINILGQYARIITDRFPQDQIVTLYENRQLQDLAKTDDYPSEWDNGTLERP